MAATRLRLLGDPVVERASTAVAAPLNTPTSLLFYLAASGDWVSRSELAYLYRPDEAESEALAYLRLQVHRAQGLPWADGLEVEAQRLRWRVDTDLAAMRAAREARRWREVINLYGGPLLGRWELRDKPTYNAWLELEREGAQQAYSTALREEAGRWKRAADYQQAAGLYQRLAALDEFDESAALDHVRTLALAGDADQALRRYAAYAALLEEELGLEPSAEFEALAQDIRGGKARASGEGAAARPRSEPAPQPATRFVGRHAELAELAALLDNPDCRLLTIVGIGGSGKTRLALELRRSLSGRFTDGARYVSLEAAASAGQALARIAHALAVEPYAQQELGEALLAHLVDKQTLLLLDNLEQLPDLAPFVARALASAPELRVVAASRVALQLSGEWLFDLRGLDLPEDESAVTADGSAAVELFVSAARRVAPLKSFDAGELADIARICRQVDGLPLALELAAAWVRAVPVARIAAELEGDLGLLSSDAVDLPERHRSIATLLDRTWDDLSEAKRSALTRLSVFRGGLSLEAGEAVTGVGLPILLSLVNQSLVSRSASGRLASHPLVLQYAYRRLSSDPKRLGAALDAHAEHYRALLERYDPGRQAQRVRDRRKRDGGAEPRQPEGADDGTGFSWRELEPDSANLEQAWFRLLATGRHASMAEVADSLMAFYNTLGFYQRGTDIAEQTIAGLGGSPSRSEVNLRCILVLALANMARERGQLQDAGRHAEDALALARRHELPAHTSMALRYRGDAQQMLGLYEEAQASYRAAIELLEGLEDPQELANTLNSLSSMHAVREEFGAATAGFERCVELFEASGDELSKAIALNNLGYIADAQGDTETASRYYEESLAAFERIQFTRGISAVKNNLVVLYGMLGRLEEAERMGLESLAMKERSNDRLGIIITLKNLADIRLLESRAVDAFEFLEPALATAIEIDAVPRVLQVLPSYAEALLRTSHDGPAGRVLSALMSHSLATPSQRRKARELLPSLGEAAPETDDSLLAALLAELPFAR